MKITAATDRQSDGLFITVAGLSKRFNREWIFRDLHYTFHPGNTYAITGPNGSGKSTLLQVLWGQMPQTSGSLQFDKGGILVPVEAIFNSLSIATPYLDLIGEFTLSEMLDFHFSLKRVRNDLQKNELLSRMYLEEAADKQLINFSSGMKQRLKLALAFFTQADVYFLDEPGTNLDQRAFAWYIDQLALLPKNALVVIASNNADEYPPAAKILNVMDFK